MTAYADYSYYSGTFLGTAIAPALFARLALRASAVIDQLTFDRTAAVVTADTDTATIDKVKMATCAVAEEIQSVEASGDGVTSESIGQYSVSFTAGSSKTLTASLRYSNAARLYLGNSELMYRGFADGEYADQC